MERGDGEVIRCVGLRSNWGFCFCLLGSRILVC